MLVFLLVFVYICIVIIAVITSKEIRGNTINRLDLAATRSGLFNFMEIWKDIDGFQGYQVSNLGNIKSIRFGKEKILKTSSSTGNYRKVKICVNKISYTRMVHKLVAIAFLNHNPDGMRLVVDHKDNNRLDNCANNLQIITQRHNSSKDQKDNTSNYIGVSWCKRARKWRASICVNKKYKFLGYFTNEIDAANAYQNALSAISIPS